MRDAHTYDGLPAIDRYYDLYINYHDATQRWDDDIRFDDALKSSKVWLAAKPNSVSAHIVIANLYFLHAYDALNQRRHRRVVDDAVTLRRYAATDLTTRLAPFRG